VTSFFENHGIVVSFFAGGSFWLKTSHRVWPGGLRRRRDSARISQSRRGRHRDCSARSVGYLHRLPLSTIRLLSQTTHQTIPAIAKNNRANPQA
jgi:hypothetical protein